MGGSSSNMSPGMSPARRSAMSGPCPSTWRTARDLGSGAHGRASGRTAQNDHVTKISDFNETEFTLARAVGQSLRFGVETAMSKAGATPEP